MEALATWRLLAACLKAGDLEGAALAAARLDGRRLLEPHRPAGVPVIAWKPGALRALARLLVAATTTEERKP